MFLKPTHGVDRHLTTRYDRLTMVAQCQLTSRLAASTSAPGIAALLHRWLHLPRSRLSRTASPTVELKHVLVGIILTAKSGPYYLSQSSMKPPEFKRVIVTPAVYPRLVEFLHFDIQSTGQKSHCVNTVSGRHNALF